MPRHNEDVASLLENSAKLLALTGGDPFRIHAYTEAARNISAMSEEIGEVHQADRLDEIPGVGASIAAKVGEYLDTGHCSYYDELKRNTPVAAVELLEVPGIGPARAKVLAQQLHITSLAELEQAVHEHKLRALPGFGEKLEQRIAREVARVAQRTSRMLLGIALPAAEEMIGALRGHPAVLAIEPAGSIRRMKETIGDIDLLVSSNRPTEVMEASTALAMVKEVLTLGPTKCSVLTHDHLQIDLRGITPDEYGSALQYFTGSKEHNIALRSLAMSHGWKLSEYGHFDAQGLRIAGRTEQEIYAALGLEWIPPELRGNRGEIEAARRHELPRLVELSDIHGDLHAHTDWSDGYDTPERMVQAAIARGYQYLAFTDYSLSLHVARGLSVERVRQQRQLIEQLNVRYAPFRVLHGTEVDILASGDLDYLEDVLAAFDVVTASVHSVFGLSRDGMTKRMVHAICNPRVDILGHPTGRLLLRRSAYEVDLDVVLRAAVEHGVALEIDGQPDRLDLDDVWARRAQAAGAPLACESDAHAARQLEFMRYAVATARRGWVESKHVLNALPLEQLMAHLGRRRQPVTQPVTQPVM
ncbi:MAG: DNA polymerase/3'-5' exonuclease PolX [Ktedonobacterales bacterium]